MNDITQTQADGNQSDETSNQDTTQIDNGDNGGDNSTNDGGNQAGGAGTDEDTTPAVTVNIGAAATAAFGDAERVRVRTNDAGALQFRPTRRASEVNLPKGETLRPLSVKGSGRRVALRTTAVEVGQKLAVIAGKYGWFTLAQAEDGFEGPTASVSAR